MQAQFYWNAVTPDYFQVMDIPFRQGGTFEGAERDGPRVLIVNRAFVARFLHSTGRLWARRFVGDRKRAL